MKKKVTKFQDDLKKLGSILEKEGKNLLKQVKTSSQAIKNTLKNTDTTKDIEKVITTNYKKIEPTVKEYATILQKEVKKLGTILENWKQVAKTTSKTCKNKITKKCSSTCKCASTKKKSRPKTSSRS